MRAPRRPLRTTRNRNRGFTLIEVMITMGIVAMLSAIAWPSYRDTVHRAHRMDARLALLRIQHQQERFYASHNHYAGVLTALPGGESLSANQSDPDYILSVETNAGGQGYLATARASASGRQSSDRLCQWFSIDETGHRRAANIAGIWTDDAANRCWR
jgi:type IV pilus assembly protein PilE